MLISIVDELGAEKLKKELITHSSANGIHRRIIVERNFINEAINLIKQRKVETLEEVLMSGNIEEGKLVTLERTLYFKGISESVKAKRRGEIKYAEFHMRFPEFGNIEVRGSFNIEHITCSSAITRLSGKEKKFILGHVDKVSKKTIFIRPIVIADKILTDSFGINVGRMKICCIMPEEIEEFKNMKTVCPKGLDIKEMKKYPEIRIKHWFAEILNEGNVPKDSPDENSDLLTKVHLKGNRVRAAFAFKGPSTFKILKVKDMGKNGDQIVKLFKEPADIFILQHCHYVSAEVEQTLQAFAVRPLSPGYYCIIDGIDSLKILKAYNKIK